MPDLMIKLINASAENSIPIGFYGSSSKVLGDLANRIKKEYHSIEIAYSFSLPSRSLSNEEESGIINEINPAGVRILFLGLGCHKKERWMAQHKGKFRAAMIGMAAAFDFYAGTKPQAPAWLQK